MNRIVIIGAGSFGGSIAELLAKDSSVTVVDNDAERIAKIRTRIDARFIVGSAETPSVLEKAGCAQADAIIAVTSNDIVNLSVCHICKTLFTHGDSIIRIARIRNHELSNNETILESFGVTEAYNTEDLISDAMVGVLDFFGASRVQKYWSEKAIVLLLKVTALYEINNKTIKEFYAENPNYSFNIIAIHRKNEIIKVTAETKIFDNDELLVVSRSKDIIHALNHDKVDMKSAKIFIAGGGNIGESIAKKSEANYNVTLIEPSQSLCAKLVQNLNATIVDQGDPTDVNILRSEDIEHAYYFCAVTENDEVNIMSALLAKQLGCKKTAVLVNRNHYQKVLLDHDMDTVISPSEITVGTILKALHERERNRIQAIDEAGAHILETTIREKAKIEGKKFNEINWPENVIPCALGSVVIKDNEITNEFNLHFNHSDEVVKAGDCIIVYVTDQHNSTINDLTDIPFYA